MNPTLHATRGGYRHGKRAPAETPEIEYAPPPHRERVVFVEEYGPEQYIKLVICGTITSETLDALVSFLDHQQRRIAAELGADITSTPMEGI
jgi:hypothetical protein